MKLLLFVLAVILGLIGLVTLPASTVTGLAFLIIAFALLMAVLKAKPKGVASVEALYDKRAAMLHDSLHLPLAPATAWPKIRDALFGDE